MRRDEVIRAGAKLAGKAERVAAEVCAADVSDRLESCAATVTIESPASSAASSAAYPPGSP